MAADVIATDPVVLNNDILSLEHTLAECRKNMNLVISQIMELDSMWDGTANATFNAQFTQDNEFANEIFGMVNSFIEDLIYAKDEYNRCENEIDSIIRSINI